MVLRSRVMVLAMLGREASAAGGANWHAGRCSAGVLRSQRNTGSLSMLLATLIANLISKLASVARRGQEIEAMSARELADIGIDGHVVGQIYNTSGRSLARW